MELSPMILWLVSGVALFIAEMLVPGVGLLFSGCGALTVGMLLNLNIISADDTLLQILIFVVSTAFWAIILWKPLQRIRLGKHKESYNNIVGETATVGEKGIDKNSGDVTWSGTIMKAKLDDNSSVSSLSSGSLVVVKEIRGNVLIVTPK